ncbi:type VI secretion system baseplate subunit TssK, partial [Xanthomonas oryzae]
MYTDAAQSELAYLSKAVKLLTDDTPRDPYVTVPVARVRRTPTGGFELDEDFIPSCAHIDASPTLYRELRGLLDSLQAKVDALYGLHRQS